MAFVCFSLYCRCCQSSPAMISVLNTITVFFFFHLFYTDLCIASDILRVFSFAIYIFFVFIFFFQFCFECTVNECGRTLNVTWKMNATIEAVSNAAKLYIYCDELSPLLELVESFIDMFSMGFFTLALPSIVSRQYAATRII